MIDKMENKQSITCPVCGGLLREHLPSMEGVLGNLFWDTKRIRIVTSEMVIECDFDHERDEEDENFPLEVPHPLEAEIKMSFDKGECTTFDILEVRLGLSDREGGMESSSDENGTFGWEVFQWIEKIQFSVFWDQQVKKKFSNPWLGGWYYG